MADESAPDLREAMSHLAAGVSLLATRDVVGRDCGLTVTSLASVSLDPPLCAVAVRRGGFLHDALAVADGWAVTIWAATTFSPSSVWKRRLTRVDLPVPTLPVMMMKPSPCLMP